MLFDGDMEDVEDVFDDLDTESNGHGWESLALWLIHAEMPSLADTIWFSSEGGTLWQGVPTLRRCVDWLSVYTLHSTIALCSHGSSPKPSSTDHRNSAESIAPGSVMLEGATRFQVMLRAVTSGLLLRTSAIA